MEAAGLRVPAGDSVQKPVRRPLEKTIVASCLAVARAAGWWAMKNHGGPFSVVGLPDILCIKEGRAVWAEVKRPGETPTRIQEHTLRKLAEAGCRVGVVTCAGQMRELLEGAS